MAFEQTFAAEGPASAVGITAVIVTTELQVEVRPHSSVTVNVTLLFPRLEQVKEVGVADNVMHDPVEPLLTWEGVIVTVLVAGLRATVIFLQIATGAGGVTMTVWIQLR